VKYYNIHINQMITLREFWIAFITISIVVAGIVIGVTYASLKNEHFQKDPTYVHIITSDYEIKPYQEQPKSVRLLVSKTLQGEWGNDAINYTDDFNDKTWKYPDALYVMTDKKGAFKGCAGIDRKYMLPCISHMYVAKEDRHKGYGKVLFETVVQHAKNVGHSRVHGLCKDHLVDYYTNFGCYKKGGLGGFNWLCLDV
jgi:GNAT superfamily N-acetyltransferase